MMLRNYASMTSLTYHEKQIEYNMTAMLLEIKKAFPMDMNPSLSDLKYVEFVTSNAFNPPLLGDLAESLKIKDKVLDIELWRDLANGWCPVDEKSALFSKAVDTPRGKMVQFTATASKIAADGSYILPKEEEKGRRCGTEFIFCFGERLSTAIGLMATQDPSVEARFNKICLEVFNEQVLPEMLKLARIRKGKDGIEYESAAEILAVPFMHSENRAEQSFYHFHFDLLNVAMGYDGELYSLCTDEIGANASALDAIFMSHMKERLEQDEVFNFAFEEVKHKDDLENEFLDDFERKTVSFDLPESVIPANVQEYRSVREKEMVEALKKDGKKGYEAEELARHATRDDKTDKSPAELREKWNEDFTKLGWTVEQFQKDLQAYKVKPKAKKQVPTDAILEDSFLRNHKEIAFTEYQYKAHIHKQLLPYMSSEEAQREATRIFEKECLLSLSKDQMEYFKPLLEDTLTDATERQSMQLKFMREARFLHASTIERDKYISESLLARKDETKFAFPKSELEKFVLEYEKNNSTADRPFKFAKGQREAVLMIGSDLGAVCNVAGRAGAGKSTLLKAAREFYTERGFQVFGTSTSSTATEGLAKDTGMKQGDFYNTTKMLKLLEEGKLRFTEKTILFWDEAGMADTKTFYEIIKHINQAGARLVLVGEREQLQPVGAGGNFRILNEQFTTTPVNQINRQVDQWQREMVEAFATGQAEVAMKTLYEKGKIAITKKEDERLEKIVDDYLTAKETTYTGFVRFIIKDKSGQEVAVDLSTLTYHEPIKNQEGKEQEFRIKTYSHQELLDMATSSKGYDKRAIKKALEQHLGIGIKGIAKIEDNLVRTEKEVAIPQKLILAATNNDIDMLNEKVRQKMKEKGMLPSDDVMVMGKDNEERGFAIGDRVIFTKNQKSDDATSQKLLNAQTGRVAEFILGRDKQPKAMKLVMDDGREAVLDLGKKHNLKHAYATSVHKSQGQTKTASFYWVSANTNSLHHAYVACSRHRKNMTMYLSEDMVAKVESKMEGKEPTEQMKQVAHWVAKQKNLDLPSETLNSFTETRAWLNEHYAKVDGGLSAEAHVLDRFASIHMAMSKTNYKKTSHDYEVLDGKAQVTYEAIRANRSEQIANYKKQAVMPPDAIKARLAQRQATELAMKRKHAEEQAKQLQEALTKGQAKPKVRTLRK